MQLYVETGNSPRLRTTAPDVAAAATRTSRWSPGFKQGLFLGNSWKNVIAVKLRDVNYDIWGEFGLRL